MDQHLPKIASACDAAATCLAIGTLFNWLPAATSLLAAIWWLIRIYETRTVKGLIAWLCGRDAG